MPSKKLSSILIIIGSLINIVGGIILIWCYVNILPSIGLLAYQVGWIIAITFLPIVVVIIAGAIVGLKYPKGGNITCLILGLLLLLLLAGFVFYPLAIGIPIINPVAIGILLTIIGLTIIGSIIGLIGVSRRKKMNFLKGADNDINLSSDL